MTWGLIWVLSIWQKIIPIILISTRNLPFLLLVIGIARARLGSLGSVKQKRVKKILGLSSIFSLGWVVVSITENSFIWIKFLAGYALALISLMWSISSHTSLKSKIAHRSWEPLFLVIFFFGLLILRGVPPFIGFFLKILILKILIFKYFILAFTLLILRLALIFVYLIIRFYLLSFFKNFSRTKVLSTSQIISPFDLFIFNTLVRVVFINIIYCKYYVSNNVRQPQLK